MPLAVPFVYDVWLLQLGVTPAPMGRAVSFEDPGESDTSGVREEGGTGRTSRHRGPASGPGEDPEVARQRDDKARRRQRKMEADREAVRRAAGTRDPKAFIGAFGLAGSGKSTLLNTIYGVATACVGCCRGRGPVACLTWLHCLLCTLKFKVFASSRMCVHVLAQCVRCPVACAGPG